MNFCQPTTLEELAQCLCFKSDGGYLVAGCTDFLAQRNGKPWDAYQLISLVNLPQLRLIELQDGLVSIGAACTHSQIGAHPLVQKHFPALAASCSNVGSQQIRNRGTCGGSIANASPAGDLYPVLLLLAARAVVMNSASAIRTLPIAEVVLGARKISLAKDEAILAFQLPLPPASRINAFAKLGERARVTIAKINLAVSLDLKGCCIQDAAVTLGAVAQRAFFSVSAAGTLKGKELSADLLPAFSQALSQEIESSIPDRASMPYKRQAVRGLADDVLQLLLRQLH